MPSADPTLELCRVQALERTVEALRRGVTMTIYQKWTCTYCESRQTMDQPNTFFRAGICEACGLTSPIHYCGYLVHLSHRTT